MKDELEFFQAWWKILRKYWNPPAKNNESEEAGVFWHGLVEDCRALPEAYKKNGLFYPFAVKMSVQLIDEVERRADELHKGENKTLGNKKQGKSKGNI